MQGIVVVRGDAGPAQGRTLLALEKALLLFPQQTL